MAKARMVDGWLCWFWVDKDNVIQWFSETHGRVPKGLKLVHGDASIYKLGAGVKAPWLNADGTTRLLAPAIPVVDIESAGQTPHGGEVHAKDEPELGDESREAALDEWDDRRLELEIEAEERAKGKK